MRRNPTFSSSSPWFHGSGKADHWESVLRAGTAVLSPGYSKFSSKKWLAPKKGMLYLTPRVMTALDYAAENEAGLKIGGRAGGWRGVVLKIEIPDGSRVIVDEDCLGGAVVASVRGRTYSAPMTCGWEFSDSIVSDAKLVTELKSFVPKLTAAQQVAIEDEYDLSISKLAMIGKKVHPLVSDDAQLSLMHKGANIAASPPVNVIGGWVISPPARWIREVAGDPYGHDPATFYERAAVALMNSSYATWIPNG